MKLVEINDKEIKDLIKKSCVIDTKFLDKNYDNNYLPDLLEVYNNLSNNLMYYDTKMKKTRNLLAKYYGNKNITDKEMAVLGYTEKCCVNLNKGEIEQAIDVNEIFIEVLEEFEKTKVNIKNVDIAINNYKFRYQDIKNLIEYRKMTGV